MSLAIRTEGLSKQYHIGALQRNHNRLGDQMVDLFSAPFRRAARLLRGEAASAAELDEILWALRDVDLSIQHGEVVGIIGRNGAGKTTLLKILSRITEPTGGRARIFGRVGSLLEVGTGFHPELTGRENISLNGAILGMSRAEIAAKFDEIVDFSEVERFIDTPVKHYSSGMYVRLAFAVAANLEPDILLVDEVLAVGDVAFQRKCLGKMGDVAREGRTVIFVSHNLGLVRSLCERGIILQNGRVALDGEVNQAADAYLKSLEAAESQALAERTDREGRGTVRLVNVEISDGEETAAPLLKTGGPARFVFDVSGMVPGMSLLFVIHNEFGESISVFKTDVIGPDDKADPALEKRYICEIDQLLLLEGRYRVKVMIRGTGEIQDFIDGAAYFNVQNGLLDGRPVGAVKDKTISVSMPHRWLRPPER